MDFKYSKKNFIWVHLLFKTEWKIDINAYKNL